MNEPIEFGYPKSLTKSKLTVDDSRFKAIKRYENENINPCYCNQHCRENKQEHDRLIRYVFSNIVLLRKITKTPEALLFSPLNSCSNWMTKNTKVLLRKRLSHTYKEIANAYWMTSHNHFNLLKLKLKRKEFIRWSISAIGHLIAKSRDHELFMSVYNTVPLLFNNSDLIVISIQSGNLEAFKVLYKQTYPINLVECDRFRYCYLQIALMCEQEEMFDYLLELQSKDPIRTQPINFDHFLLTFLDPSVRSKNHSKFTNMFIKLYRYITGRGETLHHYFKLKPIDPSIKISMVFQSIELAHLQFGPSVGVSTTTLLTYFRYYNLPIDSITEFTTEFIIELMELYIEGYEIFKKELETAYQSFKIYVEPNYQFLLKLLHFIQFIKTAKYKSGFNQITDADQVKIRTFIKSIRAKLVIERNKTTIPSPDYIKYLLRDDFYDGFVVLAKHGSLEMLKIATSLYDLTKMFSDYCPKLVFQNVEQLQFIHEKLGYNSVWAMYTNTLKKALHKNNLEIGKYLHTHFPTLTAMEVDLRRLLIYYRSQGLELYKLYKDRMICNLDIPFPIFEITTTNGVVNEDFLDQLSQIDTTFRGLVYISNSASDLGCVKKYLGVFLQTDKLYQYPSGTYFHAPINRIENEYINSCKSGYLETLKWIDDNFWCNPLFPLTKLNDPKCPINIGLDLAYINNQKAVLEYLIQKYPNVYYGTTTLIFIGSYRTIKHAKFIIKRFEYLSSLPTTSITTTTSNTTKSDTTDTTQPVTPLLLPKINEYLKPMVEYCCKAGNFSLLYYLVDNRYIDMSQLDLNTIIICLLNINRPKLLEDYLLKLYSPENETNNNLPPFNECLQSIASKFSTMPAWVESVNCFEVIYRLSNQTIQLTNEQVIAIAKVSDSIPLLEMVLVKYPEIVPDKHLIKASQLPCIYNFTQSSPSSNPNDSAYEHNRIRKHGPTQFILTTLNLDIHN